MVYTKFQGSQFLGSGGEDFQRAFIIYGPGGHLSQQSTDQYHLNKLEFPQPQEAKNEMRL